MGSFTRRLKGAFCCCRQDSSADPETSSTPPRPALLSEKAQPKDADDELTLFQLQARQIAQIPVAGMRRTTAPGAGGTSSFVTTYQTIQNPAQPPVSPAATSDGSQPKTMPSQSTISSTNTTVVGTVEYYAHDEEKLAANSTWQGKPKGTPYDRREELTQEDQDMWARMAM